MQARRAPPSRAADRGVRRGSARAGSSRHDWPPIGKSGVAVVRRARVAAARRARFPPLQAIRHRAAGRSRGTWSEQGRAARASRRHWSRKRLSSTVSAGRAPRGGELLKRSRSTDPDGQAQRGLPIPVAPAETQPSPSAWFARSQPGARVRRSGCQGEASVARTGAPTTARDHLRDRAFAMPGVARSGRRNRSSPRSVARHARLLPGCIRLQGGRPSRPRNSGRHRQVVGSNWRPISGRCPGEPEQRDQAMVEQVESPARCGRAAGPGGRSVVRCRCAATPEGPVRPMKLTPTWVVVPDSRHRVGSDGGNASDAGTVKRNGPGGRQCRDRQTRARCTAVAPPGKTGSTRAPPAGVQRGAASDRPVVPVRQRAASEAASFMQWQAPAARRTAPSGLRAGACAR